MISDRVAGNETGSGWLYGSMLSMDRSSSIQMSVKHHTNKAEHATVHSISASACLLVSFSMNGVLCCDGLDELCCSSKQ